MYAGGDAAGGQTDLADCIGWSVPPVAVERVRTHHGGAGAEAPDLGDGEAHHHRFGDTAEQGAGDHRGLPVVRSAAGAGEGDGASAVDRAFAGGVHRWLDPGADLRHRYAVADPVCTEL